MRRRLSCACFSGDLQLEIRARLGKGIGIPSIIISYRKKLDLEYPEIARIYESCTSCITDIGYFAFWVLGYLGVLCIWFLGIGSFENWV